MDGKLNELKKWMNKEDKNICICENTLHRGIYSSIDIEQDEIILSIDHGYIIEYSEIKNERLVDILIEKHDHFVLFLYSQIENPNSFWKPYFDMLPKDVSNYVSFYDKKDIQLLNMTSFQYLYSNEKKVKNNTYAFNIMYDFLSITRQLHKKHINNKKLFYDFMLYLKTIIESRMFEYTKDNEIHCGLVPYADLFNHSNDENALWHFNDENGRFEVFSIEEITSGEEICLSYGVKNNIDLLANYGFTLCHNPYSKLLIQHPKSNLLITFTLQDSYLSIILDHDYDKIIRILKKKYNQYRKRIHLIKNQHIRQLFEDEIYIIKRLLC